MSTPFRCQRYVNGALPEAETAKVARGENRGRTLRHNAVVRRIEAHVLSYRRSLGS